MELTIHSRSEKFDTVKQMKTLQIFLGFSLHGLANTLINNLKCNDRTPGPYQRLIVAQIPLGDRGLAFPLTMNMNKNRLLPVPVEITISLNS